MKRPGGGCQVAGCEANATAIAERRNADGTRTLLRVCFPHIAEVVESPGVPGGRPEYHTACPNCHCHFGVN